LERHGRAPAPESAGDRLVLAALGETATAPSLAIEPPGSLDLVQLLEQELVLARDGPEHALTAAHELGSRLVANRCAGAPWYPEALAPDRYRLSALWGLAAVAHVLAGLAAPESFRSLRLLEPPAA
ncbi:MAG: hypothetical protein ACRDLK_08975, partial [Gaiellaceae bacterium]